MEVRGIICYLCRNVISGKSIKITDERFIPFIRKRFKEFRSVYPICEECYSAVKKAFRIKYKHSIENRKKQLFNVSSSTDTSSNTQVISVSKVSISNDDDEEPTTSSAAAVRVQMRSVEEDTDDSSLSLNALNGTRRPDYQPIPRRREIQHRDPNIQNIYLSGITGG